MTKGIHEKAILKLGRQQIYPRGRPMDARFLVQRTPIMDKSTPVASMGSCFAGNVKNHLKREGFNYVQTSDAPGSAVGSAAWGTVYNTFCIRQELTRAAGGFHPVEGQWKDGKGGWLDPYRKDVGWKSIAAGRTERDQHWKDARRAVEQAGVFILTAGLTEVWFNREDGAAFFQVPPAHVFEPDRHSFRATTVDENADNLRSAVSIIRQLNPECHIILTVSPVPLRATFRPVNVVVANAESKATLLIAVHRVVGETDERVHYFPSYEIVTVMTANPFKPDNRHVRPAVIDKVMDVFTRSFVR